MVTHNIMFITQRILHYTSGQPSEHVVRHFQALAFQLYSMTDQWRKSLEILVRDSNNRPMVSKGRMGMEIG